MRSSWMALGVAWCLGILPVPAVAGLITNGGFETGDFTGWTLSGPGASEITHYGVAQGTGQSGAYGAWFGPVSGLVYISQVIPTIPTASYDLSGWLANVAGEIPVNTFEVWWNGVLLDSMHDDSSFSYSFGSFQVTATSSSTEVKLGFFNPPGYFQFDNVDVTAAIPEPATLLFCGTGLLILTLLRRGRS